ncbi:hypothetical protein JYU34_020009 [Plutella xylostella]|uniref:Uncharacterized protein n=1 Tax=Plutella xylostella TaxID=51655 RepID=A0ABQ7PVR8_PLUXY|nr:hypothetical protein JYU34_020009 [Plutella xylostella]
MDKQKTTANGKVVSHRHHNDNLQQPQLDHNIEKRLSHLESEMIRLQTEIDDISSSTETKDGISRCLSTYSGNRTSSMNTQDAKHIFPIMLTNKLSKKNVTQKTIIENKLTHQKEAVENILFEPSGNYTELVINTKQDTTHCRSKIQKNSAKVKTKSKKDTN